MSEMKCICCEKRKAEYLVLTRGIDAEIKPMCRECFSKYTHLYSPEVDISFWEIDRIRRHPGSLEEFVEEVNEELRYLRRKLRRAEMVEEQ